MKFVRWRKFALQNAHGETLWITPRCSEEGGERLLKDILAMRTGQKISMGEACRIHLQELMKAESSGQLEQAFWLETHFAEFFENKLLQIQLTGDEYEWVDQKSQKPPQILPKLERPEAIEKTESHRAGTKSNSGTKSTAGTKSKQTEKPTGKSANPGNKPKLGFEKISLGQDSKITTGDVVIFSSRNKNPTAA